MSANMAQARCFTNQDYNLNCVELSNPTHEDETDTSMQNLLDIIKEAYKVNSDSDSDSSEINWDMLSDNDLFNKMSSGRMKDSFSEESMENLKSSSSHNDNLISTILTIGEDSGVADAKSITSKLLEEGIIDAALPCLVPALAKRTNSSFSNQPVVNKPSNTSKKMTPSSQRLYKLSSKDRQIPEEGNEEGNLEENISKDTKGKKRSSSPDVEVDIHVCDEVKNIKKKFTCTQHLLISKMGYFSEVTSGQRLEDMDISVHCDIAIFEWLMRWIKKDITADNPQIECTNVIPIMISASFLQMEPLLEECLRFLHCRINEVFQTNANFTSINDILLTRLSALFSNRELEQIRDRKDRIQNRLYAKFIISLADPCRENNRGHWTSLSSLFQCQECQKLLIREIAEWVPCNPGRMRLDRFGEIKNFHVRDANWFLNSHIRHVRDQFRGNWRKVYWRLWAECHWLRCKNCQSWYPCREAKHCLHHPDPPQFVSTDIANSAMVNITHRPFPIGRYPCCNQRAFRFLPVSHISGCQFREHEPELNNEKDQAIYKLYKDFETLISTEPPPIHLPDRLTRLISYKDTKDISDIVQWQTMTLAPSKSKAGLLSRFWEKQNFANNPLLKQTLEKASVQDLLFANEEDEESVTSTLSDASSSEVVEWSSTYSETSDSDVPDGEGCHYDDEENEQTIARNKPQGSRHTIIHHASGPNRNGVDKKIVKTSSKAQPKHQNKPPKIPKKKRRKRRTAQTHWMATSSTRANQDRQREIEERLMSRISLELVQKTCLAKNHHNSRHHHDFIKSTWGNHFVPPGGTYVKLEQAWRESRGLGSNFRPSKTMGWLGGRRARTAR